MTDSEQSLLEPYLGREVVLDMLGMYVCLGRLVGQDHRYLVLEEADIHDLRETTTTREKYVLDSRLHGIRANRARALVRHDQVVSITLLEDVLA